MRKKSCARNKRGRERKEEDGLKDKGGTVVRAEGEKRTMKMSIKQLRKNTYKIKVKPSLKTMEVHKLVRGQGSKISWIIGSQMAVRLLALSRWPFTPRKIFGTHL
jgi:hypothetical protein